MRLIDADKLNYCFVDKENYIEGFNCILEEEIDNAETVDAIPIWFIRWEQYHLGGVKEDTILNTLIADWRKENETD